MRILVVEDELHLSEALSHILKKNNYTVDVANDGETGLDDALSGIYDVIVLDIMLPKMDGITVLKTLRSEGFDTPVILLTAKNGHQRFILPVIPSATTAPVQTITSQSRLTPKNCLQE